jgi:AcrR family transcriptional regulator
LPDLARRAPSPSRNGHRVSEVATTRRAQIVEAAAAIIAEKGLQHLSLSEIERKTGMARGQLTYYFPAKEHILLAVFDRLVGMMRDRHRAKQNGEEHCAGACSHNTLEFVQQLLRMILNQPAAAAEFHSLQYTFLSQINHREDYRSRLASLYEEWRGGLARRLAETNQHSEADPRLMSTLVQALVHGLAIQLAADPDAFDREGMFQLCVEVLGSYLQPEPPKGKPNAAARRAPKKAR